MWMVFAVSLTSGIFTRRLRPAITCTIAKPAPPWPGPLIASTARSAFWILARGTEHGPRKSWRGRPVCRYDAVDLSPVALELAGKNFANIECEKSFTQGDFVEALKAGMSAYDVIYIGLSLHHLLRGAKEEFLPIVRRHLTDGGSFICYEPINEPGESRDEVMKRWWKVVVRDWVELTPDERDAVQDHVFGNDYPESLRDYAALAEKAGFSRSLVRYCDPDALYAVMEFTNEPSVTAA